MPANYVLLETIQLTQNSSSITLDNIPQTGYDDLKIVLSVRTTSGLATEQLFTRFNGSSTGYTNKQVYGDGANATSASLQTSAISTININTSQSTASTFSNTEIYIPNYRGSTNKAVSSKSVCENNATGAALQGLCAGLWSNSAAITSIVFTNQDDSPFVTGSTVSIYGMASIGTTPAIAPKATGGNIVANDGTYWYHAFLSSGTFTPLQPLSCGYLVVAGGGSGGAAYEGGGGGAGGLRSTVGATGGGGSLESNLSLTAQSYLVTVGAGGAAVVPERSGNSGSNSTFATITSVGGGYGGNGGSNVAGGNGGSGGGTSRGYPGGTATSGQGYAGSGGSGEVSGGGGGAGAAGQSNGTPGAGVAISAWASPTGTGVSNYYAGGGAGNGASGIGGGAGGGGASGNTQGSSGTANTGGGGGGARTYSPGNSGAGGSGIVIVRYTMA